MSQLQNERRVITAPEAQRELGVPAATVRSWAHRGKLYAVGIGESRERWYKLSDVLALCQPPSAATTSPP